MGCSVKILADSLAPNGSRLTTFECEYWRAIHAEVMTYREFSRNAASSRAIPAKRMRDYVRDSTAGPLEWTTTKKGMQGGEPLSPGMAQQARWEWDAAREKMIAAARSLDSMCVHKSISNRLLEPFAHIRVVITSNADGLANFFDQRLHHDAEPSIQQLAKYMALAYQASTPVQLEAGEWHLPYIFEADWAELPEGTHINDAGPYMARISAARCARVSYKTHDGLRTTPEEDFALYDRLVGSDPKHASPTEHQAYVELGYAYPMNGNLGPGWVQHRKLIFGERATAASFDLAARLALYRDVDYHLEAPTT